MSVWPNAGEIIWMFGITARTGYTMMNGLRPYSPLNKIHLYLPYNGAFFGGSSLIAAHHTAEVAVIAARRTGCPVKVLDDESHFVGGDEDARSRYYFKVGFKLDGRITAVQLRCYEAWVTDTTTNKIYKGTKNSQHIHHARFCGLYKTVRPVLQAWLLDSQSDYPGMGARSRRTGDGSKQDCPDK